DPIFCPVERTDVAMPVSTRWYWSLAEPCSVRVDVTVAGDSPVSWEISRDLIQAGLVAYDEPVGHGDVTVQADPAGNVLRLCLRPEHSSVVLHLPRPELSHFLASTLAYAANGADVPRTDWVERALREATSNTTESPAVRVAEVMEH